MRRSRHLPRCLVYTSRMEKCLSQRGQRLYRVVLWCVRVMSLAELTGLKEQVPFLEGSVWEEVKSLKSAALHYNPEQGVEKARAPPVRSLMLSLNELQPRDCF